ncbi:MAG: alanine--tRNA ligase [Actinobacteria bacterium]|nr:MAG: alanine--tRNA ligase [Actinomycetota bacterium]
MTTDEIRETFLGFFEARDHLRLPSASLVPATYDPSVLLTTAGMHPLKPYFLGQEAPPRPRLTTCQKCFRTTDIENVGNTNRHLTFFEMLGNFSVGDYFKQGAVELAWELSREGFGLREDDIWVTVFEGDAELGLEADEEAIDAWLSVGVPRERIVLCPRSENFWQAGPTGPCGPCSELYYDRGLDFGAPDDLPGEDNERFVEYWNLVFMQFNQEPEGVLTTLPAKNIDTGLGPNRLAAVLQDVPSVFETDQFRPLIELGEELSGRRYDESFPVGRALRILADHSRAATFLVADGVVPSNEDRGYILRRVMRRAIQQGRSLEMEPGFLIRYGARVRDVMGAAYPELHEQRESIDRWLAAEEEGFSRTLEQGMRMLMDVQRARGRAVARAGLRDDAAERAREFASAAGFTTRFTGYEKREEHTTVGALEPQDGRVLAKLADSPFYPAGGGQISDAGLVECEDGDCRATVAEVVRLGEDQAVLLDVERGDLSEGKRVVARVDRRARHATECNHTATHLLHAALRDRLGRHVRQAGSYVGPDKLRFDFTHGGALSEEELRDVEDRVNDWVLEDQPVRALTTTLEEARRLGAMALFGEKYGDVVRMVEVGDGSFSRELCGGTHVRSTAEIGLFKVVSESSSAANVRRIEALTGPEGVALMRRHDDILQGLAHELRTQPESVPDLVANLRAKAAQARTGAAAPAISIEELSARATDVNGEKVLVADVPTADEKELLGVLDRLKPRLGDAAIVLGAKADGRVLFVASVAPALVERGVKAGAVVKAAAEVAGGGGGGRDTMARAGGRHVEKLDEALAAARAAIAEALGAA